MILPSLYIKKTKKKGRGIFTNADIAALTVVEIAAVIVMPPEHRQHLDKTLLHDYIFEWGDDETQCAMALGNIPIYNHSYKSNCQYFMNYDDDTMFVKTVRPILKGEELTINYNGVWDDDKKLWFNAV